MVDKNPNNSILLIGGDLCQRVASRLDPEVWDIYGLRRHPPQAPGVRWIRADLGVAETLHELPNAITHVLYAPSPDARTQASYEAVYPTGIRHLLDALAGQSTLQRLVLVSSTAVWPSASTDAPDLWVDENTPTCPDNFRGDAIVRAETWLLDRLPRQSTVLRLGGIYGPGRTQLLDGLRTGKRVAPDGPGHWSNRIHIDDAASACLHLLQLAQPDACYIGTDGNPTEKGWFYDRLADLLSVAPPSRQAMAPSGKRLSNKRLVASGWSPCWPDAVEGYRALLHPANSSPVYTD